MGPANAPADRPRFFTKARLTLLVAGIWLLAALPVLTGTASCPIAHTFHVACPGCGMTRAMLLFFGGHVGESLALHPLAIPTALVQLALAIATVVVTYRAGSPLALWSVRWGRASVYAVAAVLGLDALLWLARLAGLFGGPVPVA